VLQGRFGRVNCGIPHWWNGILDPVVGEQELIDCDLIVGVVGPVRIPYAGAAQDKDESTLAKSYFRWSAEGWNATTKEGEDWPSSGELGYLKSSDDDDTLWYYTASNDFLGEFRFSTE
jgi:hypothetical protein